MIYCFLLFLSIIFICDLFMPHWSLSMDAYRYFRSRFVQVMSRLLFATTLFLSFYLSVPTFYLPVPSFYLPVPTFYLRVPFMSSKYFDICFQSQLFFFRSFLFDCPTFHFGFQINALFSSLRLSAFCFRCFSQPSFEKHLFFSLSNLKHLLAQ